MAFHGSLAVAVNVGLSEAGSPENINNFASAMIVTFSAGIWSRFSGRQAVRATGVCYIAMWLRFKHAKMRGCGLSSDFLYVLELFFIPNSISNMAISAIGWKRHGRDVCLGTGSVYGAFVVFFGSIRFFILCRYYPVMCGNWDRSLDGYHPLQSHLTRCDSRTSLANHRGKQIHATRRIGLTRNGYGSLLLKEELHVLYICVVEREWVV